MYEKTANNKEVYLCSLKGSYDAILKTIILCMYEKHIIFQILCIIVVTLCPAPLKRVFFYKAPPSNKCSLLWLANWHSALWLAEHKHTLEM